MKYKDARKKDFDLHNMKCEILISGSIPLKSSLDLEEVVDEVYDAVMKFKDFENVQIRMTEGRTIRYL